MMTTRRVKSNRVLGDVLVITADLVHYEREVGGYREIATATIPSHARPADNPKADRPCVPPEGRFNRDR